jgi:hypothetical protein
MDVYIKETGAKKELYCPDVFDLKPRGLWPGGPGYSYDISLDILQAAGERGVEYDGGTNAYCISQANFEFWEQYFDDYESDGREINRLLAELPEAKKHISDYASPFMDKNYENHHIIRQAELREILTEEYQKAMRENTAGDNPEMNLLHKSDKIKSYSQRHAECASDIDAVAHKHYTPGEPAGTGMYDTKAVFAELGRKHGEDIAIPVLAAIVNRYDYDGRISGANKAWAKTFDVVEMEDVQHSLRYCTVDTHLTVLNALADKAREAHVRAITQPELPDTEKPAEKEPHEPVSAVGDVVRGYEIKQAVHLSDRRGFALGESPSAYTPFVTWQFKDEPGESRDYFWGHYYNTEKNAANDMNVRVNEYTEGTNIKIIHAEPEHQITGRESDVKKDITIIYGEPDGEIEWVIDNHSFTEYNAGSISEQYDNYGTNPTRAALRMDLYEAGHAGDEMYYVDSMYFLRPEEGDETYDEEISEYYEYDIEDCIIIFQGDVVSAEYITRAAAERSTGFGMIDGVNNNEPKEPEKPPEKRGVFARLNDAKKELEGRDGDNAQPIRPRSPER